MLQIIIEAIKNRKVLSLKYSGIKRIVHPYAVGVSLAGHEILYCYQVKGGHITEGHAWSVMELSKISKLTPMGENFQTDAPDYVRCDKKMSRIIAEV